MRLALFAALTAGIALAACNRTDVPVGKTGASTDTATASASASAAPSAAAPTPASTDAASREVTIPRGTRLPMVLETSVASNTSRPEEGVQARLTRDVVVQGVTALAEGSRVTGVVVDAKRAGKVKGRAHVALRFDAVVPRGDDARYAMQTSAVGRTAPATKKKDALEIGGGAAGGALIGALVGGKKGALIGSGVGGGAGTAYVLSTRGQDVRLGKGTAITVQLTEPLTVRIRG
jgi:hypothetical protein